MLRTLKEKKYRKAQQSYTFLGQTIEDKNTSDRKAQKERRTRIAGKQHKKDILFIHYKPCVVLSEMGVDGLGGELNKSVSVLPFREALHAEPCHN